VARPAQRPRKADDRDHRKRRFDRQQALQVTVTAERRPESERDQHPDEVARRADGDPVRSVALGQVLAGEPPDRAEDHRLRDRDRHLSGHRPRELVPAEPNEPPRGHQPRGRSERGAEVAIEQRPRRDREHDI
jgi:hypothetical protein